MIQLRRLGHMAIYVKDMDRALGFYVAGLGFTPTALHRTADGREQAYLRCGTLHHDLCLIESDQAPGLDHIAYEVGSWWEILRTEEMCKERGIEVLQPPQEIVHEGNCKSIMVQCPSGLRLELFAGMAEYDQPNTVGLCGAKLRRIGHAAPVLAATTPVMEFLTEHFGMRLTGQIPPVDCHFLTVGDEDHDLTLMKQGTLKDYQVQHVSYKVGTVAELEAATAWARSRGMEIIYGPAKRPAGSIRTLDVYDPDGNMFEWYQGMDLLHPGIPVRDFRHINTWGE